MATMGLIQEDYPLTYEHIIFVSEDCNWMFDKSKSVKKHGVSYFIVFIQ